MNSLKISGRATCLEAWMKKALWRSFAFFALTCATSTAYASPDGGAAGANDLSSALDCSVLPTSFAASLPLLRIRYPQLALPDTGTNRILMVTTRAASGTTSGDGRVLYLGDPLSAVLDYQCGDVIVLDSGTWDGWDNHVFNLGYNAECAAGTAGCLRTLIETGGSLLRTGTGQRCFESSAGIGLTMVGLCTAVLPMQDATLGVSRSSAANGHATVEPSTETVCPSEWEDRGSAALRDASVTGNAVIHGLRSDGITENALAGMQVAGIEFTSVTDLQTGVPYGTGIDLNGRQERGRFVQNYMHDLSAVVARKHSSGTWSTQGKVAKGISLTQGDKALVANNALLNFSHTAILKNGFGKTEYGNDLVGGTFSVMTPLGIQLKDTLHGYVLRNSVIGRFRTGTSLGTTVAAPSHAADNPAPYADGFNAFEITERGCGDTVRCNIFAGGGKGGFDVKGTAYASGTQMIEDGTVSGVESCVGLNHNVARNVTVSNAFGLHVHEGATYGSLGDNEWSYNLGTGVGLSPTNDQCADVGDVHDWTFERDQMRCNGGDGFSTFLENGSSSLSGVGLTSASTRTELLMRLGERCLAARVAAGLGSAMEGAAMSIVPPTTEGGGSYYRINRFSPNLYEIRLLGAVSRGNGWLDPSTRDVAVMWATAGYRYVDDNGAWSLTPTSIVSAISIEADYRTTEFATPLILNAYSTADGSLSTSSLCVDAATCLAGARTGRSTSAYTSLARSLPAPPTNCSWLGAKVLALLATKVPMP